MPVPATSVAPPLASADAAERRILPPLVVFSPSPGGRPFESVASADAEVPSVESGSGGGREGAHPGTAGPLAADVLVPLSMGLNSFLSVIVGRDWEGSDVKSFWREERSKVALWAPSPPLLLASAPAPSGSRRADRARALTEGPSVIIRVPARSSECSFSCTCFTGRAESMREVTWAYRLGL